MVSNRIHTHLKRQAALRYCSKCCVMGHPWCVFNTMTERWTFLYVVVQKSEYFSQSWQKKRVLIQDDLNASVEDTSTHWLY